MAAYVLKTVNGETECLYTGTPNQCIPVAQSAEVEMGQGVGSVRVVDDRRGVLFEGNGNAIHLRKHLQEQDERAEQNHKLATAEANLRGAEALLAAKAADEEKAAEERALAEEVVIRAKKDSELAEKILAQRAKEAEPKKKTYKKKAVAKG